MLRQASTLQSAVKRYLSAALFFAAMAPICSTAANLGAGIDERGNHYLTLDGPVVRGDAARFAAAILGANARGYRLDALRLNSPGGDVWEAMAMAIMVRWVENIAIVVQKNAKCESACFGLFAAGYRKYVDPPPDPTSSLLGPTQIGVHTIYSMIRQDGQNRFLKEAGDMTLRVVRLLKAICVPESIIGKIVTTPYNQMTYLTIEDLRQMGVQVNGYGSEKARDCLPLNADLLSPAMVTADITLPDGATIPSGTIVVTNSALNFATADVCFTKPNSGKCNISYRSPSGGELTAQVFEASLVLIKQGWRDLNSVPPAPQVFLPHQEPEQAPQPAPGPRREKPSTVWRPATSDWPIECSKEPARNECLLKVDLDGLEIIDGPRSAETMVSDQNSNHIIGRMAKGAHVALTGACVGEAMVCPITHDNQQGWTWSYHLRTIDGRRYDCVLNPGSRYCPKLTKRQDVH